jgi:SAM-dependent methyltransferase
MLDDLQYRILRKISPGVPPATVDGASYEGRPKVGVLLGDDFLKMIQDKTVIDFGCGEGAEAMDLARHGAKRVIGLDIRPQALERARNRAIAAGLDDRCEFASSTNTKAEVILSLDAFEHFADPAAILDIMHSLLDPNGCVIVSFGPTWYHPLGGHLFSVFPWAHLIFSEAALIRWRADLRNDGATRFSEVDGGLNQITIARFERLVAASKFRMETLETVSIRALRPIHSRLSREFTTAVVRTKLVPKI